MSVVISEEQPVDATPFPTSASPGQDRSSQETPEQAVDLALVRRILLRDQSALAALYDRYAAQVNVLALSILRDPGLSEEATHDVFLRVWEQPVAYDPARGAFAGWLSRVARNRAIDLLRRRREAPVGGMDVNPMAWIPDPDPGPEELAVGAMDRQEVLRALAGLPDDQRALLELAYFTGLSQREIAERLGRPLGTVKSQIRSAMRQMAGRLVSHDAPPPIEKA